MSIVNGKDSDYNSNAFVTKDIISSRSQYREIMEAAMKRVLFIYNRHAGKNKTWAGLSDMINAMV